MNMITTEKQPELRGGPRLTAHREAVIEAVNQAAGPFTVEQLFDYLAKTRPTMSRPTIYRCLGMLLSMGQVRGIHLPNRRMVCFRSEDFMNGVIECVECGSFRACNMSLLRPAVGQAVGEHDMRPCTVTVHVQARCQTDGVGRCIGRHDPWIV